MNATQDMNNNNTQGQPPPPVITPDLNAPLFFIEDKRNKNYEAEKNSRKKLTGDMDLISHFGLYYLYENNFKMRRNKPLEENSDYKSYIEDLPISKITHNTSIKDLIMAEQTKDLEILTDSESLSLLCNAFTLRPEKFPDIKDVDTSDYENRKSKHRFSIEKRPSEEQKIINGKNNNSSTNSQNDDKFPKIKIKMNMNNNDFEKPKKKRSYTVDPDESERLKKKHKKKKVDN